MRRVGLISNPAPASKPEATEEKETKKRGRKPAAESQPETAASEQRGLAMFEKVTYDYYSNDLGRAIIPDEETFNKYKLENIQFVKQRLPWIMETEENGIDSAVCLLIEIDYKKDAAMEPGAGIVSSESVSGHSISFDNTAAAKIIEQNAKPIETQKLDAIRLFCYIDVGVL